MGKKYFMFVDERGHLSTDVNSNFSMTGVVFSYDYFMESKGKESEMKLELNEFKKKVFGNSEFNIYLDDIMLKESIYKNIDENQKKLFINNLPFLIKNLKFTIISSAIKQDLNKVKDPYYLAAKNLLKNFYSLIVEKNGECGGIIMEAKKGDNSYMIQQYFFDIYNDRNRNLGSLENIHDKLNAFIVCEKNNSTYGLGIEIMNLLNSILFRVSDGLREIDSKLIPYAEYGRDDKIFNEIMYKIYKYKSIGLISKLSQKILYNSMERFDKELTRLREQLNIRDVRISEKDREINELTSEIHLLNKQLEEALLSRKNDNIIFQILSDIDIKMKGLDKSTRVAKS